MTKSATRPDVKEEPVLREVPCIAQTASHLSESDGNTSPADDEDVLCELMGYMNFEECLSEGKVRTGAELEDRVYYIPLSFNPAQREVGRKDYQDSGYDWLWTRWMWGSRGKKRSREYPVADSPTVKKRRLL